MNREILITKEDAVFILGSEEKLNHCIKCTKCGEENCEVGESKIFLNDLGDLSLHVECQKCGEPTISYIECGTDYKSFTRANKIMVKNIKK